MDALELSLNENLSIEEQYRQIDEVLARLQLSTLAVKYRRNALSPLYRLPPEIICEIFLCVKRDLAPYREGISPSKWIGLTHVSRHLRTIAVNSPSLWVDPPLGNLQWTEEMLKRSKDAGLLIETRLELDRLPPALLLALQHIAHIKVLSISAIGPVAWSQMRPYLLKSTPKLQTLVINSGYYGTTNRPKLRSRIYIPMELLRETKRLRRLELSDCDLNWTSHSHIFNSLTYLSIQSLSQNSRPTVQQFTDALRGMPNLGHLYLMHALPIQEGKRGSWASDPIHLPALQRMELQSTTAELEGFFSCVTFPSTARTHVYIVFASEVNPVSEDHASKFSALISSVTRSYSNLSSDQVCQSMILERDCSPPGIQISLCPNISKNGHFPSLKDPRLILCFRGILLSRHPGDFLGPTEVRGVITDIFNSPIPLQAIRQIYLPRPIPGYHAEMMAKTIGALPEVNFVMVAEDGSRQLLDALKLPSSPGSTGSSGTHPDSPLSFPRLTSLCLRRTRFNVPAPEGITIGELQNYLFYRRESRLGIMNLALKECRSISQRDVDLLPQTVPNVYWDGWEITDDEEYDEEYSESEPEDSAGEDSGGDENSGGDTVSLSIEN